MWLQLAVLGTESLLALSAKSLRKWLTTFTGILVLLAFVFLLQYFITQRGLVYSTVLSLKLLNLVGVFSLFFITTPPDLFALMMRRLGLPQIVSLAFSMALRFVPVLAKQTQDILQAQISRGLAIDSRNPIVRLRRLVPVLVPVVVLSIKRSIEIAEALESRAFDPSKERTSMTSLSITRKDAYFFVASLALLIIFLYTSQFVSSPSLGETLGQHVLAGPLGIL